MGAGAIAAKGIIDGMITGWAETEKAVQRGKAMLADQQARHRQMLDQLDYETQNNANNFSKIKSIEIKNAMKIEESKLDAEDNMARAMAGTGLSGTTLNEIDAQINTEVAKAHQENKQQSREASRESYLGLKRQHKAVADSIKYEAIFNGDQEASNAELAAGAAMLGSVSNSLTRS